MNKFWEIDSHDIFFLRIFTALFGGEGIWTPDLLRAKQTLSQLSYTPVILKFEILNSKFEYKYIWIWINTIIFLNQGL